MLCIWCNYLTKKPRNPLEHIAGACTLSYRTYSATLQGGRSSELNVTGVRSIGRVWLNLWETPVDEQVTDIWFHVLHEIVPTKVRSKAIGMSEEEVCSECQRPDTIHHRLVECGDGATQWDWLRIRISVFLRRDPADIRAQWLYWPQFRLWPPTRHRASLWCLAQMLAFICAHGSGQEPCDFFFFFATGKVETVCTAA
jgi:hypothetical protein